MNYFRFLPFCFSLFNPWHVVYNIVTSTTVLPNVTPQYFLLLFWRRFRCSRCCRPCRSRRRGRSWCSRPGWWGRAKFRVKTERRDDAKRRKTSEQNQLRLDKSKFGCFKNEIAFKQSVIFVFYCSGLSGIFSDCLGSIGLCFNSDFN